MFVNRIKICPDSGINFSFDFLGLDKVYFLKITSPMNSYDGSFFKYVKTFASDLYLICKLSALLEFVYKIKIGCSVMF